MMVSARWGGARLSCCPNLVGALARAAGPPWETWRSCLILARKITKKSISSSNTDLCFPWIRFIAFDSAHSSKPRRGNDTVGFPPITWKVQGSPKFYCFSIKCSRCLRFYRIMTEIAHLPIDLDLRLPERCMDSFYSAYTSIFGGAAILIFTKL